MSNVDSQRRQELVDSLLAYGLNEYESRAYLALLERGPAVAGDIARRSGIPRPRVYDTLQRLIDSSLVTDNGGSPRRYAPLPLDDFLSQMTAEFRRREELLKSHLADVRSENRSDGVFHVHDEAPLFRLGENMILGARRTLEVRLSPSDFSRWSRVLIEAARRGVQVTGQIAGAAEIPVELDLVSIPEGDRAGRDDPRRILLVRDGEDMLVAMLGGDHRPYGLRTRNWLLLQSVAGHRAEHAGLEAPGQVNASRNV